MWIKRLEVQLAFISIICKLSHKFHTDTYRITSEVYNNDRCWLPSTDPKYLLLKQLEPNHKHFTATACWSLEGFVWDDSVDDGLPWRLSGKESACRCRRNGFSLQGGKMPWERKRLPTPVSLPKKPHGQRSVTGCSPRGHERVRHDSASKGQQLLTPSERDERKQTNKTLHNFLSVLTVDHFNHII